MEHFRVTESVKEPWQAELWRYYATIPQFGCAMRWLGACFSRVKVYVGHIDIEGDWKPSKHPVLSTLNFGGEKEQKELLRAVGVNLGVAGDCQVGIKGSHQEVRVWLPSHDYRWDVHSDSRHCLLLLKEMEQLAKYEAAVYESASMGPIVLIDSATQVLQKVVTFESNLFEQAQLMQSHVLNRLRIGLDYPEEAFLGLEHNYNAPVDSMFVKLRIEPAMSRFCVAVTTQFLEPVLAQLGLSNTAYAYTYDVSDLAQSKPQRLSDLTEKQIKW